ncbi:MAG TPA: Holliday junction branch migration protein RuvA [Polyangia bacterium]|jgi:Holliday junction DNA helicase RuvA|nr:Holliday junction branch migration protein RuvA [Polyangia bacterium]
MIAHLRGQLIENDGETIVVDVAGVGYQVWISGATLGGLPALGVELRLHVHSHFIKDEPLRLYGFTDADERRLFQTLIDVQGVGPRVALAILAGLPAGELVRAIAGGDVARLTQIKGVGRKIAERLTVELRDKIAALPLARGAGVPVPSPPRSTTPTGPLGDVYGALVALGFRANEFEALLGDMDPARPTADLVKQALSALRRR